MADPGSSPPCPGCARRDQLLRQICHELRTPLSVLFVHAEVLKERAAAPAPFLRRVESAILRLDRLVQDLLDLAGGGEGSLRVDPVPCDLGALCRQIAEEQGLAGRRAIAVQIEPCGTGPIQVRADPVRIAQVLTNLLGNAVAYVPLDRPIGVRLSSDGDQARVEVWDKGPGLPTAHAQPAHAQPHELPADAARPLRSAGPARLGVGLAVCREILSRHQSVLEVTSVPAEGASFSFTLPILPPSRGSARR